MMTILIKNYKKFTEVDSKNLKKKVPTVPVRYVPLKVAIPYVLKALNRTYLPSKISAPKSPPGPLSPPN